MRARSFIVAIWLLPALAEENAQRALERSIDAEKENMKQAEAWVYDEKITYTTVAASGKRKDAGSAEFEVIALEGRPYYKLVRRNGKKLNRKEQAEEDERMEKVAIERQTGRVRSERSRLAIPFGELAEEHFAVWNGDVLQTAPKVPGLARVADLITTEQWLDPKTMLRRKAIVHFVESSGVNPENTAITFEFTAMPDGTSLAQRIFYSRPYRQGKRETEQVYTNYRKFEAISVIKSTSELK